MGANYVPSTPQDVDAEPSGSVSAHNQATDAHVDIRTELAGKQPAGAYLTSETDPTVPQWAKQAAKPTYTANEVGADASGTAASAVSTHNASGTAHSDIRTALAAKANTSSLATVATSGSYADLSNKPTIPTLWSGTQTAYNALGTYDANTLYLITGE